MSEKYVTEKVLDKALKGVVDELSGVMNDMMDRFDGRFNKIEKDLEDFKLETRQSFDTLTNTIDGFVKRLEDYEVESRARDHEMDRIKRWVEQIAAKTGVKLEY